MSGLPSGEGWQGSREMAEMLTELTHGMPPHWRSAGICVLLSHVPVQSIGAEKSVHAAPSPGHFAAEACISLGSAQDATEHSHVGHVDFGTMGSPQAVRPGAR